MSDQGARGLLDASTVVLLPELAELDVLPHEPLISVITLAELSVGPLIAATDPERDARQAHVQQAEADFDPFAEIRETLRVQGGPVRRPRSSG